MGLLSFLTKPKWIKVQKPPKRFIKSGTVTVQFVDDPTEIKARCKSEDALACSVQTLILMPNIRDLEDSEIGALLRHEVAHALGGWNHEAK